MSARSKHLKVADQTWWHGVNISEKLKVLSSEHPVEPLARRQPQWQSVSSFFTRASKALASEEPGCNMPGDASPGRRSFQGRQSCSRKPSKGEKARPKSAAGTRRCNAFIPAHRKDAPVRQRRPQSAPALLRNDEPRLIAKKTHEDPLRQHVEDMAVHERMEWLKREGFTKREMISRVDVLADPILFDLKVLHNSAARAKTPAPPVVPKKGTTTEAHPVEKLRGLSRSLAKDTHRHCTRLEIPHRVVEGPNVRQLYEKLKSIQRLTAAQKLKSFHDGNDLAMKVKSEIGAAFAEQLKGLWGNAAGVSPGDLSHPLVRLAYFLNGNHDDRMRMVLHAFDADQKGSINQEEFSLGLELMGYQSVSDYKDLFLMLDSEGQKELELEWLEAHLKSLVND